MIQHYVDVYLPGMALMSALGLVWIWLPKLWKIITHKERVTYEQRFKQERHNDSSDDLDGFFDKY